MKYFFFDLETTGVDVAKHGIHQIAGILKDGEAELELNYKVRPREGCMLSPEALEIGGVTAEQLREYPPMNEVYSDLVKHLNAHCDRFDKQDKYFLVGYNNASFDNQFLRQFFTDCGDKYFGSYFWSNSLDVMVLASLELMEHRSEMTNFKLHNVAVTLGLEVDPSQLHDALYDVRLTKDMFDKMQNGGRPE